MLIKAKRTACTITTWLPWSAGFILILRLEETGERQDMRSQEFHFKKCEGM